MVRQQEQRLVRRHARYAMLIARVRWSLVELKASSAVEWPLCNSCRLPAGKGAQTATPDIRAVSSKGDNQLLGLGTRWQRNINGGRSGSR